jgi:hypothetical protein
MIKELRSTLDSPIGFYIFSQIDFKAQSPVIAGSSQMKMKIPMPQIKTLIDI